MKRSRIRPISKRRAQELAIYRERRKVFLIKRRWCSVFKYQRSTQVHHMKGRTGKRLLDERFWLAVSWKGQLWIHENVRESIKRGWIILR